jgi:HPt (histidine-containing phosphotransfer) domain-containing protein
LRAGDSPPGIAEPIDTDMTSADETAPDFDASLLADLESSLPRADFRVFIEDYLASMTERLQRVAALVAANDTAALSKEAHILISTAGSYGLRRASLLARRLEAACKSGETSHTKTLACELGESAKRACRAMRERFLGSATDRPGR